MSDPTPTGHVPAKKKKKPLVLIIAVAFIAVAAAGGSAWFFMRGKDTAEAAEATKEEQKKDEKKLSERGLVTMDPFIVNLADEGGKRFLRASIQLVVEDAKEAAEFVEKPVLTMGARSAIVNTLTTQTAESIGTPEGKEELRKLLKKHVSEALGMEIVDVLLSDFVVQY